MSRQSSIENYFKTKGSAPKKLNSQSLDCKNMSDKKVKRRNLSLIKPTTPNKNPKISDENKNVSEVIILSSDDEDLSESPEIRTSSVKLSQGSTGSAGTSSDSSTRTVKLSQGSTGSGGISSDSSTRTVIYSLSPVSPKETLQNIERLQKSCHFLGTPPETCHIPRTPQKTPQSPSTPQSSQSTKYKSPSSSQKFFSPTKNRTVVKRSPSKVKRSLSMEMASLADLAEDENFAKACEGMDDKSKLNTYSQLNYFYIKK